VNHYIVVKNKKCRIKKATASVIMMARLAKRLGSSKRAEELVAEAGKILERERISYLKQIRNRKITMFAKKRMVIPTSDFISTARSVGDRKGFITNEDLELLYEGFKAGYLQGAVRGLECKFINNHLKKKTSRRPRSEKTNRQ
jgi:hypothetical protein